MNCTEVTECDGWLTRQYQKAWRTCATADRHAQRNTLQLRGGVTYRLLVV